MLPSHAIANCVLHPQPTSSLSSGTAGGFGFSLATHPTALDNGYIHYISEVDPGSSAGTEGLRLGDRVVTVDATQCNSLPHKFVAALFAQAGRGDRPVCMVVSDATGTISDALARTKQVSVAPADAVVPSTPRYPGQCHVVIKDPNGVDDFDDLVMELARVRFGGKYPWEHHAGWLYHDERNPLAKQPLGPAAKDKIVLVLCGMIPLSAQIKNCENAGAKAVIFVNTVATAPIANLELGPHEREDCVIPGLNISMRDGVVLLKMCKQAAVPATVFGGPEILLRRGGGDDADDGYLRYQPNEDDDSDDDEDDEDYDEEEDDPVDMNPGMVVRFGDDDADEMTIRCGHADFGNYLPDDGMTLEIFYPDGNETADRPFASALNFDAALGLSALPDPLAAEKIRKIYINPSRAPPTKLRGQRFPMAVCPAPCGCVHIRIHIVSLRSWFVTARGL